MGEERAYHSGEKRKKEKPEGAHQGKGRAFARCETGKGRRGEECCIADTCGAGGEEREEAIFDGVRNA